MRSLIRPLLLIVLCVAGFMPLSADAARIYFESNTNTIMTGDTIIVHARIDSERSMLNVVDGAIETSGTAHTDLALNSGGSSLTLFTREPTVEDNATITFTGGAPQGFRASDALLFSIIVSARTPGTIVLHPTAIAAYLNDGAGTREPVSTSDLTLTITPRSPGSTVHNEWTAPERDTTPPLPFEISIGSDPSVFDGKRFAAFSTTDADSGIDYYTVAEGNRPAVRSSNTYVLQSPTGKEILTVTAFDKAGNIRIERYRPSIPPSRALFFTTICVLLSALLYYVIRRVRRAR